MEPQASLAKLTLQRQVNRCRQRLSSLHELRDHVCNSVDEASENIERLISKIEEASVSADTAVMKQLQNEIRVVFKLVRKYEDALDHILGVGVSDEDSDQSNETISNVPRQASDSPAVVEGDLLHFSDNEAPITSPVFNTAESGSASLFNDSVEPLPLSAISSVTENATVRSISSSPTRSSPVQTLLRPPLVKIAPGQISARRAASYAAGHLAAPSVASGPTTNLLIPIGSVTTPNLDHSSSTSQPVSVNTTAQQPSQQTGTRASTAVTDLCGRLVDLSTNPEREQSSTSGHGNPPSAFIPPDSSSSSQSETCMSAESIGTASEREDEEASVQPIIVPDGQFIFWDDKSVRFYMRHVISPDEFYVQPLSHVSSTAILQLRHDLKVFYEDESNRVPLFSDRITEIPQNKRGYCGAFRRHVPYTEGYEIERCVILDWRETSAAAQARDSQRFEILVRFVDWGPKQWVRANQIWKIDRKFCKLPALTIQCKLFDTRPREEGNEAAFGIWPEQTIRTFKAICVGEKPLRGYVMTKNKPYGLVIYVYSGVEQKCVNAELVVAKLAKTLTNWLRAPALSRIDSGRGEHELTNSSANWNVDFLCFGPEIMHMQPPRIHSKVYVDVIKFFTCCRFSVNFPQGTGDVGLLERDPQYRAISEEPVKRFSVSMNEMNEFYSKENAPTFPVWPMVGQLVAAKFSFDNRYYRARLLDTDPQDGYRVRYLDYGNDEWRKMEFVRPLRPQYHEFPYMAMECRLANLRPLSGSAVEENINRLVELINGQKLLADIVDIMERHPPAGPMLSVILASLDKRINFNDFIVQQGWATYEGN